ncbi:Tma23 protein [Starmerella bacillaris]|uniref:Tma23 protein n=1 Tax=Starmerella bacillaris TaxID=1247836 RepID=A0AAV5RQY0_STABA|nr:Tma23 protein [Starmerella bacillaris]
MDAEKFLIRQGWKKGEGLRPNSIKRALLVAHKRDSKGLGFNPQASDGWWERMFDGHLKSLNFDSTNKTQFKFDEEKRRRETSPLYSSFLSAGYLNNFNPDQAVQKEDPIYESNPERKSKNKSKSKKTKSEKPESKKLKSSGRVEKEKHKKKHKKKNKDSPRKSKSIENT